MIYLLFTHQEFCSGVVDKKWHKIIIIIIIIIINMV